MAAYWKYGLAVGAGVAVGALGVVLLSKHSAEVKKTLGTILSHGMDIKEKAETVMENAKENMEDIAAEARHARQQRKTGKQSA